MAGFLLLEGGTIATRISPATRGSRAVITRLNPAGCCWCSRCSLLAPLKQHHQQGGTVGRVLQLVAKRRAPRRRTPEQPLGDGLPWPMLQEQQALQARLGGAEQVAAVDRAQVLITQGWGALEAWLMHEGQHPGERAPATSGRRPADRRSAQVLDLFDAA